MAFYDVFNGDADGLCALQQIRLHTPRDATPVTGVKRDIALLDRIADGRDADITVLDIGLDRNRDSALRLLQQGARLTWFDHHVTAPPPQHPHFEAHLDASPDICTSLLVDRELAGAHRAWAVVGAFGDNLIRPAQRTAASLGLPDDALAALRTLGECLNYNAYGERVDELMFHPAELTQRMRPFDDPLRFIREDAAMDRLQRARDDDLSRAIDVRPTLDTPVAAAVILPDASWSRRVIGTFGNHLATTSPRRAHAVLVRSGAGYTVSVRAPQSAPTGADALARRFGGGGRAGAAGVETLPESEIPTLLAALGAAWR
ncbi:MAG: acetyltransferase [Burkholderiales bacterium]|nr:acetyltransferase [Burkholderiales bacterium]